MGALALVWAVVTALSFGAADFAGGLAARRAPVVPVVLHSQLVAAAVLGAAVLVAAERPTAGALGWGGAAGVAAGAAFLVYYRGLAIGRMGVVATATALASAVVPAVVGVTLGGERPSPAALVGVVLALVAMALLSSDGDPAEGHAAPSVAAPATLPTGRAASADDLVGAGRRAGRAPARTPPGLVEGLAAGVGYGAFFICIDRVGEGSTAWPLLAASVATVVVVGLVVVARRVPLRLGRSVRPLVAVAGVAQVVGGVAVLLSVREGPLSLVAVVAALSPVPTMVLARLFLAERLGRRHVAGVGVALVGIALIAGG